jgi:outer membrane biosynthesis protein TonB
MAAIFEGRLTRRQELLAATNRLRNDEISVFFAPRRNARKPPPELANIPRMRGTRSPWSLLVLAALSSFACGGSPPPPPNSPEATPAASAEPEATAPAAAPAKPRDEDGWAGENVAKNGGGTPDATSASAAAAPSGDPKAPETRTMEVIRKLVVDNRKAARKCYEDARKDSKDLKGDVVIHFVLDPEGNVKTAELNQERSTLKSPAVVDCVMGVIKGIKFPKSSRGMETSTNYPFNFTP